MTEPKQYRGANDALWLPFGLAVLLVGGALAGAAYLFDHGTKELQSAAVKSSSPAATARQPAATPAGAMPTPQAAPAPQSGLVFRCQVNGRVEYRDSPCDRGGRTVDTSSSSGVRLADPRAVAAAAAPSSTARVADEAAATMPAPEASNRAECDAIARHIAALQASARQLHPPTYQDYLRAELAKAKSGWAELKCHGPIE